MRESTSSASPSPRVAVEINAATKALHLELNRLIVERLPLALPPHTQTPARYAIGLSRFATIYYAFESVLDVVSCDTGRLNDHDQAVAEWLGSLIPKGLQRSSRLRSDVRHLQKSMTVDMSSPVETETQRTILELAGTKPHVLVAYAWIMYMAIFSGGRWIREQLASPGTAFWDDEYLCKQETVDISGFSFLSFDEQDGEGLKTAFKKRLSDADELLTTEEHLEIVDAGREIFKHCIEMIHKIDRDVWWYELTSSWSLAYPVLGLGSIWLLWRLFTGQRILTD